MNNQSSEQAKTPKVEQTYSVLGEGNWVGNDWVVKTCPMCGGQFSFHFMGITGMWSCSNCDAYGDFAQLKQIVSDDLFLSDKLDELVHPSAPEGLIQVGKYVPPERLFVCGTGYQDLDEQMGGLFEGEVTIVSGKRASGKSTITGEIALNAVEQGAKVCFYSGELNAGMFQNWILSQAAGAGNMEPYTDRFGIVRFYPSRSAVEKIKPWLVDKFILYDNSIRKSSERNAILERFQKAKKYYGCTLFFVDNLMTARYTKDGERDYYRQQSNFVGELVDFAHQENAHVVLIAHPKKGDTGDENENVAGLSDITNRASNVLTVYRQSPKEKMENGMDTLVTLSKNRNYGALARIGFNFDSVSRRLIPASGEYIERYGWEDL